MFQLLLRQTSKDSLQATLESVGLQSLILILGKEFRLSRIVCKVDGQLWDTPGRQAHGRYYEFK